jgi:3-dehydroquinate dehydratase II
MYKSKILVINGPNLNMLGIRDPKKYGDLSLKAINEELQRIAEFDKYLLEFFQSNNEGEIISRIQKAYGDGTSGILINAAAYTHTSIGILDALTIRGEDKTFPYVEVHLSNPKEREAFRHHSYLESGAIATISGKQAKSYYEGLRVLIRYLEKKAGWDQKVHRQ